MSKKTNLHGYQFVWDSVRKNILDDELFKSLPAHYIGMQRLSNDNCIYMNKFKGCHDKTPCYCAIILNTSDSIEYDLLSEYDLRLNDSIIIKL